MPSPLCSPSSAPLPRFFGPYILTECIGSGGTGVVHKAIRRGTSGFEKLVVIKTLLPELAGKPLMMRLFTAEAKISAQLLHTNIVQIHDFGVIERTPFLELEYLPGWNLKELWDRVVDGEQRVPVSIALTLATEACQGLAYAHSFLDQQGVHRKVIHRDVSPANVMVCRDGTVKLLDFGLATVTRGETLSIETFHGKLAYMSPEQLERGQVDRRADVYALGVLLHELLTGKRLFHAATDADTVRRVRALDVEPPSRSNPLVSPALDALVSRALARDPGRRYPSAVELRDALEALRPMAATRRELLAYLGSVAPEVFTTSCCGCGAQLPCGAECTRCHPEPTPALAPVSLPPPVPTGIAPPPPLPPPVLMLVPPDEDVPCLRPPFWRALWDALARAGRWTRAAWDGLGRRPLRLPDDLDDFDDPGRELR